MGQRHVRKSCVRFVVLAVSFSAVLSLAAQAATAPVGATPGSFSVDPNGGANYTIPIQISPGSAGLAPSIALTYSKQVDNPLVGVGFSISGLSIISRCGGTIALDGAKGGVYYDSRDRFCLDGQRLIAVNGADGAHGTEYRTERESFAKIFSYDTSVCGLDTSAAPSSGPACFKVFSKDGMVSEYGISPDSRIQAQGKTVVRLWALNKVQDTRGNYFTVQYEENIPTEITGEYRPVRIDYTGDAGAGLLPYNSVRFVYGSRTDIVPHYEAGSVIKVTQRLTNVQTYTDDTLVRDYRLGYDNNGAVGRSRLISVTECGNDGVCLPSVVIDIQSGSASILNASGVISPVTSDICANGSLAYGSCNDGDNSSYIYYPDINGDGRADLCYRSDTGIKCLLSTGSGWGTFISTDICANGSLAYGSCNDGDNFSTMNFADVNGDGMADLVYRGDTGIQVWLSTGTGFTAGWSSDICANGSLAYGSCNDGDNSSYIYYPDINGDGRADLCYRSDTGIKCFLSTGSGWGTFISTDICANGSLAYGSCNDGDNFSTINFADVNGDGMADLVYRSDTGIRVWLSTGTGFTPGWSSDICANGSTAYGSCNDGDNFSYIRYPDINGDGRADLCYRSDTGIKCFLSTGSGWGTFISTDICANGSLAYGVCNDGDNFSTINFADVNGDGMADLVYRSDTGIRVWLSTGTGFTPGWSSDICANGSTAYGSCNDGDNFSTICYPDINGDGRADLCYRSDTGIKCFLSTGSGWGTFISTDICANGSLAYGVCNDGDNFSTINFADVNGDGMADLVYRSDTGIRVWLSTGTGFTPGWSSDICANGSTAYGSCNDGDNFSTICYPDINGDGRADLCYRSDTGIKCFLSTGSGWGTFISTDICANGSLAYGVCNDGDNFSTINFADVNGDGMADLVYRSDTGIRVWLSTGTGFTPGWSSDICANGSTAYGSCNDGDNFSTICYPDINGDGRADLCYRSDTGIKCFLSTGSGWGTFISTDICANGSLA